MIKKLKPGYIIIFIILAFVVYKKFFDHSKEIAYYTKNINSILEDIRHQDYFKFQNRLEKSLQQSISIESLQNYMEAINLKRGAKFIFKDYKKRKNLITVDGIVVNKGKKLNFKTIFIDCNGTLLIKSQKIGKEELKVNNPSFPIICKSSKKL